MELYTVPIEDLREDPENAREHPPENLEVIRSSLERFGQVEPLVTTEDGKVIAGNGRLQVMKDLRFTEVKVVFFNGPEEKARALALVLNRSAELARWRPDALGQSLLKLEGLFNAESLGFDAKALGAIFPESGAELQVAQPRASVGLGTPIIQYALIFDDEGQQQRFFEFLRKLKSKWPELETMAARLDRWITDGPG